MSSTKRRTVCRECRARHLKCDQQTPSCTRCATLGIECVKGYTTRFIHHDQADTFPKRQPWVSTTPTLTFQTEHIDRIRSPAAIENDGTTTSFTWTESVPSCSLSSVVQIGREGSQGVLDSPNTEEDLGTPLSSFNGLSTIQKQLAWANSTHVHESPALRTSQGASSDSVDILDIVSGPHIRPYQSRETWPTIGKEEAELLRYYCEHLARNFDLLDPHRYFRHKVPERASSCPILLYAILALSARHLSRVADYNPTTSNRYHQECLDRLIPTLNDAATTAVLHEDLLASIVILRHLEEIEVPLAGQSPSDHQSHLLGTRAFITAQGGAVSSGSLREAASWVALRQEIHVAFVYQRPIIPELERWNLPDIIEGGADVYLWSRKIVLICAEAICYCFRPDRDRDTTTYANLLDLSARWFADKPRSFDPFYCVENNAEEYFPQLWFWSDDVVTGWEHYYLTKILLTAHNPTIPRLGPRGLAACRASDEQIRDCVRALCGICLGNTNTTPTFAYASMAIAMAGDKFTDHAEQQALLRMLTVCESQHGWPTSHTQEILKEIWS